MDLPVNVAVIGCGAAFEHLYRMPLLRLERKGWLKVIALAEPNPRRQELARSLFPSATVSAAVSDISQGISVGLTVITSPPPLHFEHARVAMEAGSHILCEKPIADTVASGRSMMALAREHGRKLAIGQTRRFYPCLVEAKRWLAEGRLGKVLSYRYQEGGVYTWPVASDAPFRRSTSGGGNFLDKGVHVIDLLCWLFGAARLVSHADDAQVGGVECLSETTLAHGEVVGHVVLAWDQDLAGGCLIRGERGDLWFPSGMMHDLFFRSRGGVWDRVPTRASFAAELDGPRQTTPRVYFDCIELEVIQVLRAILKGERVSVDGDEALVALELIELAYAVAQPLEQSWLPESERELAQSRHWRVS